MRYLDFSLYAGCLHMEVPLRSVGRNYWNNIVLSIPESAKKEVCLCTPSSPLYFKEKMNFNLL